MSTTPSAPTQTNSFDLSTAFVKRNPSVEALIADGLKFDNDVEASNGALAAFSGKYTGRTPKDKFIVATPDVEGDIWWGNNNRLSASAFRALRDKAQRTLVGKDLYLVDAYAAADPAYRIAVRFIVERPYHALFIRQLLIRPSATELTDFKPEWTVVNLGKHQTEGVADGVAGDAAIVLDFAEREVLIFGTEYAGEMKKAVFTIMNLLLPRQGVLSMHCSANVGSDGQTALFFGLSGTGKTTLSADPERRLIGDDEHGWSDQGIFNIEGGCYAKCIRLSAEGEPEIWHAIKRGAVLENVVLGPGNVPDYDDGSITENTRCAYPVEHIENRVDPSVGGHPSNIVFLTCDALGVLPPISRLTAERAMELFLLGYTAKLAGTEVGVVDPILTFSTCFGAPFLPLHPHAYADLLGAKIKRHNVRVWMINTGWTGGPYGEGSRIKLAYTRAMIRAAFSGALDGVVYMTDERFGLDLPTTCPDVPTSLLDPRRTWKDPAAFDAKATYLKSQFDASLAKIRSQA
ncbi:MAG: phosphoenolpyruvate carboxykinase (ATP) [Fimbriimonadaceae bacterium]